MNGPNEPDDTAFTVVYDSEEGEVVTHGFGIQEAIQVRQGLIDKATRYAAVAELERLGYTITGPHAPLTEHEMEMHTAFTNLANELDSDAASGEYRGGSYAADVLADVARRIRVVLEDLT